MNSKSVNIIYEKLHQSLPDARSELIYQNSFELLIAVILSAQATDKSVNLVTPRLFKSHPTPKALLSLSESKLKMSIKTIGLASTKAKNIIKTCKMLLDQFDGEVPDNREDLETLPGVGRKTANVVLNEGFNQSTIAVDTHVFRLANRTGLAPGKNVLQTELKLLEVTPKKWLKQAHHYLILHGRYVCKATNYLCTNCVINKECEYPDKKY